MGWFASEQAEGAEAGRRDAEADVAAGGFARGWDGTRRGEPSEAWSLAYDEAYVTHTPESWWRD